MTAQQVIDYMETVYTGNRFQFDFNICQYIAGDANKKLRQEIVFIITGESKPVSKCGMYAVSDLLKAKFEQLTLF